MSEMYHWWGMLRTFCMWKMVVDGMLIAFIIRVACHVILKDNPEGYKKLLRRGLVMAGISAVVTVFVLCKAAQYECPWFLLFRIPLEFFTIGAVVYFLGHCGWYSADPERNL